MPWHTNHGVCCSRPDGVFILVALLVREVWAAGVWFAVIACDEVLVFHRFHFFVPNYCFLAILFPNYTAQSLGKPWRDFCVLDDLLSARRHKRNLPVWILMGWLFCRKRLCIWCKLACHRFGHFSKMFLFVQDLKQFAKWEWVLVADECPFLNLGHYKEYVHEILDLFSSQCLRDKMCCN